MTASLNEKLRTVKWGEYKLGDIFEVFSYKKRFDANKVCVYETGRYPYIVRMGTNNGQKGYINEDTKEDFAYSVFVGLILRDGVQIRLRVAVQDQIGVGKRIIVNEVL
ncbi:MAG: restriction endonuclease subunit S [Clostridia bacterium]|nr:restriction endonuclease subunit S [Clostridia bacterium]